MSIEADAWELSALIRDKSKCDRCNKFLDNPHISRSRRFHSTPYCQECAEYFVDMLLRCGTTEWSKK